MGVSHSFAPLLDTCNVTGPGEFEAWSTLSASLWPRCM